jgi:hypothetical protein
MAGDLMLPPSLTIRGFIRTARGLKTDPWDHPLATCFILQETGGSMASSEHSQPHQTTRGRERSRLPLLCGGLGAMASRGSRSLAPPPPG